MVIQNDPQQLIGQQNVPQLQEDGVLNNQAQNGEVQQQPLQMHAPIVNNVESTVQCKLPRFWQSNPRLWFAKVESSFNTHRVRSDMSKYDLVVNHLDDTVIQDLSDILLNPPENDKYVALKNAVLERFADTADRQLHKLLTELQLGDKKPSQLLRQMRSLAGTSVTDDALRIKWLDLLPAQVSKMIKILKSLDLDEQANVADEILDGDPAVAAVTTSSPATPVSNTNCPPVAAVDDSSTTRELAAIRLSLAQLVSLTRQNQSIQPVFTPQQRPQQAHQSRNRSQSRSRDNRRGRSATPNRNLDWCWYHQVYGNLAQKCKVPCSFQGNQ